MGKYKTMDDKLEELQTRISELELERQKLIVDRDEIIEDARKDSASYRNEIAALEQKNDDLAIANADYEMQLKQLREAANESHQEAVQTSRQLHEANGKVDSLNRVLERFDRDFNKAIAACHQHLLVSLDLPTNKPDCEVCETSRFIYHLLDVLNGK